MKPIIVAIILLNLVFGAMLGLAVKSFPEWLALELAMVLGALQAVLFVVCRNQELKRRELDRLGQGA